MMTKEPHPRNRPTTLIVGNIENMPILGRMKQFFHMDESTICTVETKDRAGNTRGAVAFGMSHHAISIGYVIYSQIDETEAIIALLQNAVIDAKRIEAGLAPFAQEGMPTQQ